MGYRDSRNEILTLIKAKYPLIQVVTDDDIPAIKTFEIISHENMANKKYNVMTWNIASGIYPEYGNSTKKGFMTEFHKPLDEKVQALYSHIKECKEDTIFVLQDFDFVLQENKHLSFGLKEVVQTITNPIDGGYMLNKHKEKRPNATKHVVIVSSTKYIPKELDKLVNLVEFSMPGKEEIRSVIELVAEKTNQKLEKEELNRVIAASHGLTETELTNALFKSVIKSEKIDASFINEIKKQIISKGEIIEYADSVKSGIDNIGGMDTLKDWVVKRKIAFNDEVRKERNLKFPKGALLTGIQGGGKSLAAKCIAGEFGYPLLRFDIGKVKGMYVGQSEENMRKAIRVAKSVAPCVLWIDEIEKAFPDPKSPNTHEVSKGLLGYFLTWMQEKEENVFVIATANNIDGLPPELIRKGRFDEIFWVDLPDLKGRMEITKSKLKDVTDNVKSVDIDAIAEASNGYTGAELEAAINEANFNSAHDNEPLNTKYILDEINKTSPISVIRKDSIKEMQEWAKKNKVRSAN